ncbi:hypothetical protein HPNQ4099_1240 [Helicobacter pylori NQ4099]|uniref:Uncharacterized protein n=1 Tax=Helicobacter pylori NQ4099 TaxID=992026 RepID=J0ISU7_HELPX|nr:hypothetical protein HPNQ4099_1240 [Helicobacter pylori NQ4099]
MDRVYMGMGLYGGEKIKRLTRERERKRIFKNNNHYKTPSTI